eukprot:5062307-Lingulodinium_polyedra.AAC.1
MPAAVPAPVPIWHRTLKSSGSRAARPKRITTSRARPALRGALRPGPACACTPQILERRAN